MHFECKSESEHTHKLTLNDEYCKNYIWHMPDLLSPHWLLCERTSMES